MTTVSGTLSNYSEVLKTYYLEAIRDQLNHDTPMVDLIDVNTEDVAGTNATINCHYGRNTGIGARADNGTLPTPGYQKHKKSTIPMKKVYGRVAFTGPTIAATRSNKGAYAQIVDNEMQGLSKDFLREINRMRWGVGFGILGRWETGASTTETWGKQYRGNTIGGDGFGSTFGGKYLVENNSAVMVVVTTDASTYTAAAVGSTDIAASAVDETSSDTVDTLTVTDPGTPAAGDFFVREASMASTTTGNAPTAMRLEPMGLRGIVTDTDIDDAAFRAADGSVGHDAADPLQALAVATYPWWKAEVDTHPSGRYQGQRALSFKLMDKMFDKVERRAGKDIGPNMLLTAAAIRREYADLCRADRRQMNTMTLDGGWTGVEFRGIPLMVDPFDAIDGELYFLTLGSFALFRMSDYDWMDKDGSIFARVADKDAYEATLFAYQELGCYQRNLNGVICDLSYDI